MPAPPPKPLWTPGFVSTLVGSTIGAGAGLTLMLATDDHASFGGVLLAGALAALGVHVGSKAAAARKGTK